MVAPGRCASRGSQRLRDGAGRVLALVLVSVGAPVALAHDAATFLAEVVVTGHPVDALGQADSASQGVVGARQLGLRPLLRPGEILEAVPGMVVTQHSGDGKANQFFLRGFNLDHGTDFATHVAGMPVNLPTHAHGHGYTDLNFLIPELIERIAWRKGPYHAADGDFASAGSARISLRTSVARPFAQATFGPDGYRRTLAAGSSELAGDARLLAAVEVHEADGPWTLPQRLRRANALVSLDHGDRATGWTLTAMSYRASWRATDQIPQRAIDAGLIGRFDTIDPSSGGSTARDSLSGQWRRALPDGSLQASVWAMRYRLGLYSNFTYALDDPIAGDQFLQRDGRTSLGGQIARHHAGRLGAWPLALEAGVQVRHDRIRVGLFDTVAREVVAATRDDLVAQANVGAYLQGAVRPLPWLRALGGIRADRHDWRVTADQPVNGGRASAGLVSPKLGLALGEPGSTELYANWGRGFHSNDGRGTTIRIDPASGEPATRVPGLVATSGEELGLRLAPLPGLRASLALWQLRMGSELLFVGDAGTTEASRPSRRLGIEAGLRWLPRAWLAIDADLALTRPRFVDGDAAGDRIPGSIGRAASVAVTVRPSTAWSAGLLLRHLGPRPLVEDGAVMSAPTTLLAARAAWRPSRRTEILVDAFNLLDRRASDIEYFYVSRLRGEVAPVADRHLHPVEPRTLRVTLRLTL